MLHGSSELASSAGTGVSREIGEEKRARKKTAMRKEEGRPLVFGGEGRKDRKEDTSQKTLQ
jgi:hypothetical protein